MGTQTLAIFKLIVAHFHRPKFKYTNHWFCFTFRNECNTLWRCKCKCQRQNVNSFVLIVFSSTLQLQAQRMQTPATWFEWMENYYCPWNLMNDDGHQRILTFNWQNVAFSQWKLLLNSIKCRVLLRLIALLAYLFKVWRSKRSIVCYVN